jgi:hypothetical protein
MRQMSYSLCRFWAYDESKKIVGAGASRFSGCYVTTFLAMALGDLLPLS